MPLKSSCWAPHFSSSYTMALYVPSVYVGDPTYDGMILIISNHCEDSLLLLVLFKCSFLLSGPASVVWSLFISTTQSLKTAVLILL